ncbi:MAG: hypothetical protein Q4A16_04110 [Lautropia sp.]|nr:hypothetical protein [Lautropia sp.]
MFNWFRQSSKSTRRHVTVETRHLKQYVDHRSLSQADAEAMLPGASKLNSFAQHVLAGLPAEVRPAVCCQSHPWMLERLLDVWENPAAFRRQMQDLLLDTRGNRQGFGFAALTELSTLNDYYNTYVNPMPNGWATIDPRS